MHNPSSHDNHIATIQCVYTAGRMQTLDEHVPWQAQLPVIREPVAHDLSGAAPYTRSHFTDRHVPLPLIHKCGRSSTSQGGCELDLTLPKVDVR